jgi:hypothetical protein
MVRVGAEKVKVDVKLGLNLPLALAFVSGLRDPIVLI